MLEIRTKQNKTTYLILLLFIYLFSFFDIVITAYLTTSYGTGELNPLYHIGGWDLLILFKLVAPIVFYWWAIKKETILPLSLLFALMMGTCFWNALVWLNI